MTRVRASRHGFVPQTSPIFDKSDQFTRLKEFYGILELLDANSIVPIISIIVNISQYYTMGPTKLWDMEYSSNNTNSE